MITDWNEALRVSHWSKTGKSRGVRFPSPSRIAISGSLDEVVLHLRAEAVLANMQSNEAAFEGWALVLRRWCEVKSVQLSWDKPEEPNPHYNRFLYRLANFNALFGGEWFSIKKDQQNFSAIDEMNSWEETFKKKPILNVGGVTPKHIKEKNDDPKTWTEDDWESHLVRDGFGHLRNTFGLSAKYRPLQQFPVGLFESEVSSKTRLFPGQKSAIDILALDGDTLHIFELKKDGNIKVGALSELMFYTSVIRDAIMEKFGFPPLREGSRSKLPDKLVNVKRVQSVILTPSPHPLIDGDLLRLLNEAYSGGPGPSIEFFLQEFDNKWSEPDVVHFEENAQTISAVRPSS